MAERRSNKKLLWLCVGALGIVYGDIGTSPLYAINELFFGRASMDLNRDIVLGGISLVLWALTIVVAIKYIWFVLKADNEGEGGVFALYGLLNSYKKRGVRTLMVVLILAAGFLLGDGIITPSISVLSAVEGLEVATPFFKSFIVPITVAILTVLFYFQHKGTAKMGSVFGPIISLWFVVIAVFGARQIFMHPDILNAFNPLYGIRFLQNASIYKSMFAIGAVMLVLTGAEALYADMGHFGRKPIRIAWFSLVYPALIFNYLGQGAYLLSGNAVENGNVFYSMLPRAALYPMVALATVATIIASQALISGAFSLISQAVALGVFPRLKILHTHALHEGQIYLPFVNWALYFGCVILVVAFGSSSGLAAAYGLAVSGVMLATSLAMFTLARFAWRWGILKTGMVFGFFIFIDLILVAANALKFFQGGFVPLVIGLFIFTIMATWRWGRRLIHREYLDEKNMTVRELVAFKSKEERFIDKSVVIMAHKMIKNIRDTVPSLTKFFTERYGLLPKNLIFLNIITKKVSHVRKGRCDIRVFQHEAGRGSIVSITMMFGFMENPNVEAVLEKLAERHRVALPIDPANWLVHVSSEKLVPARNIAPFKKIILELFQFLRRNSMPAYHYYGLGKEVNLSMEIMPVKVG